ncbi:MAG: potassium/proton antiporter [Deinococcota bacterium]|nr:potassium/proton antiporter [Deinococcota bacterium]
MSIEFILTGAGILLLLSIIASKASGRLGVPSLVLFLVIGVLAGSEGLGGIDFANPWLAQSLGVVALAFILFSGGLDTDWKSVRPVLWHGLGLSTLAVLVTAASVGLFAMLLLNFSFLEGLLLGAIVSSTDAAAVFAVMRSRSIGLQTRIKRILEFESGSNDPMAIFLTLGFITLIMNPGISALSLVPMFFQQMLLGGLVGYGLGRLMVWGINRINLGYDGLYLVFTLSVVMLVYGLTSLIGGNGFLAVYIVGLVMGNHHFIHKKSIARFHDGIAWLMQIVMFITLGLLVFPSQLVPVVWVGLLLSLFLIFVARPLGVFATLGLARMRPQEMAVISWVGLRGAVPIILATFPLIAGVAQAEVIFNLVFFIVLTSVLLQGPSIPLVAKWFKVDAPLVASPRYPLEFEAAANLDSELVEVEIPEDSPVAGRQIVKLGLPDEALVVLISRDNTFVVPRGATVLKGKDRILVLADEASLKQVRAIVRSDQQQGQVVA